MSPRTTSVMISASRMLSGLSSTVTQMVASSVCVCVCVCLCACVVTGPQPSSCLWNRAVAIPRSHDDMVFETDGGVPQEDPLSTLIFATSTKLLMKNIIRNKAPNASLVAYVDDTVLLGTAEDVTTAITEIQIAAVMGGLKLQKSKTQVWVPTQHSIDNEPLLRVLQGRMGDKRGILILGETVSKEPEDAIYLGDEAFATEHIAHIKQLLDDLCKLDQRPYRLTEKRRWGCKLHGASSEEWFPVASCMYEGAMHWKSPLNFGMMFKERFIAYWARWTDQGTLTPGQHIVELPIEHGLRRFRISAGQGPGSHRDWLLSPLCPTMGIHY